MIKQPFSTGPCKYLHNQDNKLCKVFTKERKKVRKDRYSIDYMWIAATRSENQPF